AGLAHRGRDRSRRAHRRSPRASAADPSGTFLRAGGRVGPRRGAVAVETVRPHHRARPDHRAPAGRVRRWDRCRAARGPLHRGAHASRLGRRRFAPRSPRGPAQDPGGGHLHRRSAMRGELRYRSSVLLLALALCAAPAAVADRAPPPDVREIPIEIPDPTPTGLLLAWKPTVLSVRLDTGTGDSKFGSESFEPGRGLARFTFQLLGNKPFFGRVEAEGGQFKTSEARLGSTGADITGRFLAGAATRITSGVVLTAGAGVLTRYEWGRPTGGVPTIGMFGVASNLELDIRLLPAISLGFFVEGAIAPFPHLPP